MENIPDMTRRIRDERQSEERLQTRQKREVLKGLDRHKTEFVSAVSHELRTPLSIIKQLLMLLYEETLGPLNDKQREVLVKMRHNVERLKDMIDKLLDVSRIERGKLKLHYSLVSLHELLGDSEDYFKESAQEKGIILKYHFPKEEVNIFVDAERVYQVISNLINNAIKFTDPNGKIRVEVKVLEAKIRIGVFDTGIGIAESDIPKIFNKFRKVSTRQDVAKKGVGLGLAIAKELVDRHGGEIWAESQLGVGSRFYFTLPRFYTADLLTGRLKESVNAFLRQKIPVHLINLLIVNYEKFKERITVAPHKMAGDIKGIIDASFKEFFGAGNGKRQLFIADMHSGKYSLIFPATAQEKVDGFCDLLSEKIKSYFITHKIENVFIALGILSYPPQSSLQAGPLFSANLNIKEIYIGAEMRRYRRIQYKTSVEVVSPKEARESCQSLDISQGGLCFISRRSFKTDAKIAVNFFLLKKKKVILAKGRVTWMSLMDRFPQDLTDKYKLGLEFLPLKDRDRKLLLQELELYYE